MLPKMDAVIEGMIFTLTNDIQPEMTSAWGRRQAISLLYSLEHLRARIRDEREMLRGEHRELVELFAAVRVLARAHADVFAAWSGAALADADCDAEPPADPAALSEATLALRRKVDAVIRAAPRPETSAGASALSARLMDYVAHQVARDEALLAVGPMFG